MNWLGCWSHVYFWLYSFRSKRFRKSKPQKTLACIQKTGNAFVHPNHTQGLHASNPQKALTYIQTTKSVFAHPNHKKRFRTPKPQKVFSYTQTSKSDFVHPNKKTISCKQTTKNAVVHRNHEIRVRASKSQKVLLYIQNTKVLMYIQATRNAYLKTALWDFITRSSAAYWLDPRKWLPVFHMQIEYRTNARHPIIHIFHHSFKARFKTTANEFLQNMHVPVFTRARKL